MRRVSLIVPIIIFLIPLIIGICMFIFPFGESVPTFTKIGLLMIGFFGLITRLLVLRANIIQDKLKTKEYESSTEYKIKKNIQTAIEEAKMQGAREEKNKRIKCEFCKCTFDSYLDKCPNCGAPPERKN